MYTYKIYLAFLLLLLPSLKVSAQRTIIQADYFLQLHKTYQPDALLTDDSLKSNLINQVVAINVEAPLQLKSVTVDYSLDQVRWYLQESLPINYVANKQNEQGIFTFPLSGEKINYLQQGQQVFIRLTFFNTQGLFCEEIIQRGVRMQPTESNRDYSLGKGLLSWFKKKQPETKIVAREALKSSAEPIGVTRTAN